MYWQEWSGRLKTELGLATHPVAITFAGAPAPNGPVSHGKASVCQALKRASEGECIAISVETCGCPGGLVSLGLGQLPPDGKERLVEFLIEKEKVYASRAALNRGQGIVPVPLGAASQVVFSPLAMASLQPDIVAFIGPPGALHRIVRLARFEGDQALVGVPFFRLIGIMHALDHRAGSSREEKPEAVERQIEGLGRVQAA